MRWRRFPGGLNLLLQKERRARPHQARTGFLSAPSSTALKTVPAAIAARYRPRWETALGMGSTKCSPFAKPAPRQQRTSPRSRAQRKSNARSQQNRRNGCRQGSQPNHFNPRGGGRLHCANPSVAPRTPKHTPGAARGSGRARRSFMQKPIQGPENAPIARFAGLCCYQSRSEMAARAQRLRGIRHAACRRFKTGHNPAAVFF